MAKILTTKGSAAVLEDIIRRTEKEIFLISYSYIISESFITRLRQAAEKGIVINIVYGKSIKEGTYDQLKGRPNVKICYYENLHAKIFANESKCLIGSMNFSKASEINNTEIGVMLSLQSDKEAFEDAIRHCKEIVSEGKVISSASSKLVLTKVERTNSTNLSKQPVGYCIRTKTRIPLNHEKPYCPAAYADWQEFDEEDDECEEDYDHFTGEKSFGKTCLRTPILNKNWQAYQKAIKSF